MKTIELTGATLDYWAIKAEGCKAEMNMDAKGDFAVRTERLESGTIHSQFFNPSGSWGDGGPIIERERIEARPESNGGWSAIAMNGAQEYGPTPLIAAMRAFVASKFGDDVPDVTL